MSTLRRLLVVMLIAVAALAAGGVAGAAAQTQAGPAVFFKVVFTGSGQYSVDGSASCNASQSCFSGPFHEDLTWDSWTATYPVVQLDTAGASGTATAANQQAALHSEGNDTDCDDASTGDCHTDHCFAGYDVDPGGAPITLDGTATGSSLKLRVEAPWHYSLTSVTCALISLPDPVLPDTIRAVTTIPLSAFDKGTVTRSVSSSDPDTYQTPADCTAEAQADNSDVTSCTRTSHWTGTLTITPDCVTGSAEGAPWCISKKEKDDAAKSAKDWRARQAYLDNLANLSECDKPAGTVNADPENKWNCAVQNVARGTAKSLAQEDQKLADDPPDPNYASVATPKPAHLAALGPLKRRARQFVLLETRYAKTAALMDALLISQDRATGAFLAMSQGTDAAAALKKQNAAVLSYAKQAKQLLNGQHAIAVRAARELRGHGTRGRKLAALLLNGQAVQEDTLTASALGSISH